MKKVSYLALLLLPLVFYLMLFGINRSSVVLAHICTPETPPDQKCFTPIPSPTEAPTPSTTPSLVPSPTPPATPVRTPTPCGLDEQGSHPCSTTAPTPTPPAPPPPPPPPGPPGPPSAPVCVDTAPNKTTLVSVNKLNPTTVSVHWNKVSGADSYSILYGLSSGNYTFGVASTGDTNTFTVGSLDANANYCFIVRSVHGCNSSDYSNEICLSAAKQGQVLGVSTMASTGNLLANVGSLSQGLGLMLTMAGGLFYAKKARFK